MSVSIKYKGSEIASMSGSGTKTLKTSGKYCEGDITVQNTEESQQAVEQATPTLSVNTSTGVVTAEATQEAGNVAAGTKTATLQLPTKAGEMITPSISTKTVATKGKFLLGNIFVANVPTETKSVALDMANGDQVIARSSSKFLTTVTVQKPDTLLPENIKAGVDIGGVVGTLEGGSELGDATQVYIATQNGAISDGMIISQTGEKTFLMKSGISSGLVPAIVGGLIFLVSPSQPIAIFSGDNVDIDYTMVNAETSSGHGYDGVTPVKVVKVTGTAGSLVIGG